MAGWASDKAQEVARGVKDKIGSGEGRAHQWVARSIKVNHAHMWGTAASRTTASMQGISPPRAPRPSRPIMLPFLC